MRSSSPLFSSFTKERSISPQARRPFNHTTYWIRFSTNDIEPSTSHEELMRTNRWKYYVDYLRQLKQYNYILVCDKVDALDRINVIIQYQTPTIIDPSRLPSVCTIRESPLRLYKEKLIHSLTVECEVIEEGGAIDYELIDRQFVQSDFIRTARSTSPIFNQR